MSVSSERVFSERGHHKKALGFHVVVILAQTIWALWPLCSCCRKSQAGSASCVTSLGSTEPHWAASCRVWRKPGAWSSWSTRVFSWTVTQSKYQSLVRFSLSMGSAQGKCTRPQTWQAFNFILAHQSSAVLKISFFLYPMEIGSIFYLHTMSCRKSGYFCLLK